MWSFVLMRQAGQMRMECIFAAEIPFCTKFNSASVSRAVEKGYVKSLGVCPTRTSL